MTALDNVKKAIWQAEVDAGNCTTKEPLTAEVVATVDRISQASIVAYHAWLDANGWQIVPKVPTGEMAAALFEQEVGADDIARYTSGDWSEEWYGDSEDFNESWAAMLAAAPKPEINK